MNVLHAAARLRFPIVRLLGSLTAVLALMGLTGCVHFRPAPLVPAETAAAFGQRSLADAGLLDFLRANHVAPSDGEPPWDVNALTFVAFYYQPGLAEARVHLEAVRAAERTAAQRPNPTLSVTPSYDNQIPDNPTPWSLQPITLDLPIETMGKRRYRLEQARATTAAESWNLAGTIWQVRSKVRAALLDLYLASERRRLLTAQVEAQGRVVRLLQGQLAAGTVSGFEFTQARIADATTQLAAQDGLTQYSAAQTELASALGVPRRAIEGVQFSFAGLETIPPLAETASLRGAALERRADVRAALAQYAAAQAALQIEVANQYPDIHLGPGYQYNSGNAKDSMWQLTVGLNLPIFNQNQGPIAETSAKRREAAAHFLSVQADAINQIDGAVAAYQVAVEEMRTATALISDLDSRRRSALALQRAGEADPLATNTAEMEYYAGAIGRLDALLKAQQAYGLLEDAVQDPSVLSDSAKNAAQNVPSSFPKP